MASYRNIQLCQTRILFNQMSQLNNRKTNLLTSRLRKQPFAMIHQQKIKSSDVSSSILKANNSYPFCDNLFNKMYHNDSDSYDRVDRHVSLGQDSNKLEDSDDIHDNVSSEIPNSPKTFRPKNILILTKLSRYEYEKEQLAKDITEDEFRHFLENRGSDYTLIKYYHNVHKSVEEKIVNALEKRCLQVKICQRTNYCDNLVNWADLIVTAGGDGTFLLGASKIKDRNQPIIGINTDPTRSEGHLCLPKHWSLNVDDAIQALVDGKVKMNFDERFNYDKILR